ncbi:MAG: sugar ABC transporter substrate-binding protein [Thermoleophilia bacterium]|nr:sugar ABC transporter substrate-binding protein [Thermoleophilia bacterium]
MPAACSGDSSEPDAAPAEPVGTVADTGTARPLERSVDIAVVTHGEASDPFWAVVKKGIDHAARDMGATVTYSAPDVYEPIRMRELIEVAVASRPNGLVVTIPDADVLAPALAKAVRAGIPVVAFNTGLGVYRRLGARLYVGQPEDDAAFAAGRRMASQGVRNALCVNHEPGVASLRERCRSFTAALARSGGTARVVTVQLQDPEAARRRIAAAVSTRGVDGILTLGPGGAAPALEALRATRRLGKVAFGTFDLSPEVLRAVHAGEMEFAIDQQPFLQGYLPVVLLTQYELYGVLPARGSVVPTGPSFVTERDVARVVRLSEAGIR